MREIKFRGFDKINNVFRYGNLIRRVYGYEFLTYIEFHDKSRFHYMYMIDHKTVGQYIGLKDKSGNEIYEGDILGDFIGLGVVKYNECTAGFVIDILGQINEITFDEINYNNYVLEVIGNIYENPDILDIIK